jgi:hypothetical protein
MTATDVRRTSGGCLLDALARAVVTRRRPDATEMRSLAGSVRRPCARGDEERRRPARGDAACATFPHFLIGFEDVGSYRGG